MDYGSSLHSSLPTSNLNAIEPFDKVVYCGEVKVQGLEQVGVGIKIGYDLWIGGWGFLMWIRMGSRDVETECFVPLVPHFSAELRNVNQVCTMMRRNHYLKVLAQVRCLLRRAFIGIIVSYFVLRI